MNLVPFIRQSALCRVPVALLTMILIVLPPGIIPAQAPDWWGARGVLKTDGSPPDDYAALNQGQLKNLVRAAVEELDAGIPKGAGDDLHAIIAAWGTPTAGTDDYAAVNIGQLKALAMPIYDRLIEAGYTTAYPWAGNTKVGDDFAAANIGQAKNLFAFDVTTDTHGVGVPDWWQAKYGLSLVNSGEAQTVGANGVKYATSFQFGIDPNDANSANVPRIINGQTDGLSILDAETQDYIASLKPPSTAIEIALYSNVEKTGYALGGWDGTFDIFDRPFAERGNDEYSLISPLTHVLLLRYTDVLTAEEFADYQSIKALHDNPPEDLSEWITDWHDTVEKLHDWSGDEVLDSNGDPRWHGTWSGIYHWSAPHQSGEFVPTGATAYNDRLTEKPPHSPDVTKERAGKYWGSQEYTFTDVQGGGNGSGEQITIGEFAAIQGTWLTIDEPDADLLYDKPRVLYEPNGRPLTATANDRYKSRLKFWLRTDDQWPASSPIRRLYLKTTTTDSDPSLPATVVVELLIPKGRKVSNVISLQPEPGQTQSLSPLPVDIAVRKKGAGAAPDNGLIVKRGDILEVALAPQYFDQEKRFETLITWEYCQLRGDGTYTDWTAFGNNGKGTKFEYATTEPGIFRIRAKDATGGTTQEYEYTRKKDAPFAKNSRGDYNQKLRKGRPDFIGITETEIQIAIRNQALSNLGSPYYKKAGSLDPVGYGVDATLEFKNSWKCNIFVFRMANGASATVPTRNWREVLVGVPPWVDHAVPPAAGDWHNAGYAIGSWTHVGASPKVQPGFTAIHQYPSGEHHIGILDYDGTWINAGQNDVNKSIHVTDDKYQPTNFRRHDASAP